MSVLQARITDAHGGPAPAPCATSVLVNCLPAAPDPAAAAGEEIAP